MASDDRPGAAGSNTILHLGAAPVPRPSPRPRHRKPTAEAPAVDDLPAAPPARFVAGETVPGTSYRIIRFIGDGGMGAVYEAEHTHLERRVALKILLPEVCRNPEVLRLFRAEAKAASRIGSEHIVDLYDFAELDDGRLLFTMELLKGPTLARELTSGPMAPSRVIAILRQLCKGLSAAHAAGIVHRDIKPDNIVLTTIRGRADAVKILDFGIAGILGDEGSSGPLQAGTPHYLAPELISGTEFDDRADIYAVGCTAFAMLTGHPPYDAGGEDAVTEILAMHLADPVPRLVESRRELVEVGGLCAVVQRCLAKRPDERYGSMDELEADLCGAQIAGRIETNWDDLPLPEGVPMEIRDQLIEQMPTLAGGIEPAGRRRWLWPMVTAAALALGIAATYYVLSRDTAAPPEVTEAEPAAPAQSYVDTLVAEAQAAADAGFYIYPPADDPTGATAYGRIRELESLEGELAEDGRRQARRLRQQLAALLVRLGDDHWSREGKMEFAEEYYAQALLFDGKHPRALERATAKQGDLDALVAKAEEGKFSPDEIAAADSRRVRDRTVLAHARAEVATAPSEEEPSADDAEPGAADSPDSPNSAASGPSAEQSSARDLAKLARDLAKKGEMGKAEDFVGRALIFNPRDELALATKYDIVAGRGEHRPALALAKALADIAPGSAKSQMRLGGAHGKLGQWTKAYAAFVKAEGLGAAGAKAAIANAASHGGVPPEPEPAAEPNAEDDDAEEPADPSEPADGGEGADPPPAVEDPTDAPTPAP